MRKKKQSQNEDAKPRHLTEPEFQQLLGIGYAIDALRKLCADHDDLEQAASLLDPIYSQYVDLINKLERKAAAA